MAPRIELREVSKAFPGVRALQSVSLEVQPGEIHALLGENGAGKSTLGKIIAGVYARDSGEVRLDGAPLGDIDEAEAGRLGIGVVHQEGSLVRTLSIADNVFAGRQPTRALRAGGSVGNDRALPRAACAARRRHRPAHESRRALLGAGSGRGNRQGAVARFARSDPRRADGGADADRNGSAFRHSSPVEGERRLHRLCLASFGGNIRRSATACPS